jgi:hypothetical protein
MNVDQTLAAEVAHILNAHPTLGADGFLCPFTPAAARFPAERAAAFEPDFVQRVATVLEILADPTRAGIFGCCETGTSLASNCSPREWVPGQLGYGDIMRATGPAIPLGAAIVALHIVGAPFARIPGSANVKISRKGRS